MKILRMGMSCPLGLRWLNALAAFRAGLVAFEELVYRDNEGQELIGAVLSRLDSSPSHHGRWKKLLAWALDEVLEPLSGASRERLPLVLVLPPGPSGEALEPGWFHASFDPGNSFGLARHMIAVVPGHESSSGLRALSWAKSYVEEHGRCLVAASDSLIGAQVLAKLERDGRLMTESNADGLVPGEGAACVLLGREEDFELGPGLAHVRGVGFGRELGLLSNDIPLRAEGISMAARESLSQGGHGLWDMDFRVSDAAGEGYAFKEQALLLARLMREKKDELPLMQLASGLGHMGAAAGVCGVVLAAGLLSRDWAPGPRGICFASGADGERGAVVLESINQGRSFTGG